MSLDISASFAQKSQDRAGSWLLPITVGPVRLRQVAPQCATNMAWHKWQQLQQLAMRYTSYSCCCCCCCHSRCPRAPIAVTVPAPACSYCIARCCSCRCCRCCCRCVVVRPAACSRCKCCPRRRRRRRCRRRRHHTLTTARCPVQYLVQLSWPSPTPHPLSLSGSGGHSMSDLRGDSRFLIPDSVSKILALSLSLFLGYARSVPLFSGQFAIVTNANFDILYLNARQAVVPPTLPPPRFPFLSRLHLTLCCCCSNQVHSGLR